MLAVAATLAAAATQQGRRWVWPTSDAERFSGFSYRPPGGRSVGRSLGYRPPPPGSSAVRQNRLVTSGTPPVTSTQSRVTSSELGGPPVLPFRPGFEGRLSHNADGGVSFGISRIYEQ